MKKTEMFKKIEKALFGFQPKRLPQTNLTEAAVLVPLFVKEEALHFLMTRRTNNTLKHKGQISFPGGVREPSDQDEAQTALREAFEEIGLEPSAVMPLGWLNDLETYSGFRISPLVGRIPYPYPFKPNPDEVEEILEIPWSVFSEEKHYRQEKLEHEGQIHLVHFYQYHQHVIWGATAKITRQLVKMSEAVCVEKDVHLDLL